MLNLSQILFWTEINSNSKILRAGLSGQQPVGQAVMKSTFTLRGMCFHEDDPNSPNGNRRAHLKGSSKRLIRVTHPNGSSAEMIRTALLQASWLRATGSPAATLLHRQQGSIANGTKSAIKREAS
ncbi:hypothetical protein PCANC_10717 [Puccinia coronata f. sp. avenae]|uniref:Uncharacterized protein n=1 Tax=Puccinia coronata f. sp. avenae TaxID=200324 RepID=A0A2N5VFZ3_9BASI|nr:hypothetical protein PCANC_10717 [Puccinia coronata f. sp. avenae]